MVKPNQTITMTEHDLLFTLALQHVPNIGDIIAKRLISHCGSAEAVLKEKKQNLLKYMTKINRFMR